ncbi:MAG TPA: PAS domain-containing protein [Verrucomicrobiae bacterium]
MKFNAAAQGAIPDIEYFQHLADGAPVMIWMSGADMGCFYFNTAWLQYRGRTLSQEFGNGWAEGVHPEDLERCVQHYVSSFQQRVPFVMSYRLQHHTTEYRWILDRGSPHYTATGEFLGFFGGCAETPADSAVERIQSLRESLDQMSQLAARIATEARTAYADGETETVPLEIKARNLLAQHRAKESAALQFGKLAADMREHDRIPNGACLR